MDGYLQAPVPQQTPTTQSSTDISKAPKWLKKPVSAKFGVSATKNEIRNYITKDNNFHSSSVAN